MDGAGPEGNKENGPSLAERPVMHGATGRQPRVPPGVETGGLATVSVVGACGRLALLCVGEQSALAIPAVNRTANPNAAAMTGVAP